MKRMIEHMLTKKLKHGDTFYYILKCHHNDAPITFDVFAYEFHDGDDRDNSHYDPKRMFNTQEEAEEYVEILMKN